MDREALMDEVLIRLSKDTTTSYYTDAMLRSWIDQANKWGAGFRKWPFTEYMDKSAAHTQGTEQYSYPNAGFKTDSIRLLKIGTETKLTENKNFEKKNFDDYMRYREDYPDGTDEIFSDFGRTVYINPNCASGSIYAFGQLEPAHIDEGGKTVFGNAAQEEGDNAILEKVLEYAYKKEKKFVVAIKQHELAKSILIDLWEEIQAEQHAYQTKDRGMFKRINVLEGNYEGEINSRLQF